MLKKHGFNHIGVCSLAEWKGGDLIFPGK